MRRATWLTLLSLLLSCDGSAGSAGSSSATRVDPLADAPRLDPLPDVSRAVVRKKGAKGLVTAARVLVPHQTTQDSVRIALRWEDDGERPLPADHPLAAKRVDLDRVLATLTFSVLGPTPSDPELRLRVAPQRTETFEVALADASLVLSLDGAGVQQDQGRYRRRWESRPGAPTLLARAGTYTLRVSGNLADGDEAIPFESGDLIVEVSARSDANLSDVEIERLASREVHVRWKLEAPPMPSKQLLEDAAGNRIVRFLLDPRARGASDGSLELVEVLVGRNGDLRSLLAERLPAGDERRHGAGTDDWASLDVRPRP